MKSRWVELQNKLVADFSATSGDVINAQADAWAAYIEKQEASIIHLRVLLLDCLPRVKRYPIDGPAFNLIEKIEAELLKD